MVRAKAELARECFLYQMIVILLTSALNNRIASELQSVGFVISWASQTIADSRTHRTSLQALFPSLPVGIISLAFSPYPTTSIDKIHAKPVQYQTSKHEIRKSPLTANMARILLEGLSRLRHGLRST